MKRAIRSPSTALTGACLGLLLSFAVQACAEEEDSGSCNVEEQSGCDEGLVCRQSSEGGPSCFCSTDMQTGCEDAAHDCYDVEGGDPTCSCSVDRQTGCSDDHACEQVIDGAADCFPPVTVGGRVFDLATDEPVAGAIVVARDANNAAVSGLAVTDEEGLYSLVVPTPRNEDGSLVANAVTLRADAAGYVKFPQPPRSAVPVDTAMASGDPLHLESSATDIGLIALPDTAGLGTITGTVNAERPRGTVVVAGGTQADGGGVTGIAGLDGAYTIFNVPAGSVAVQGYKAGLQLDSNSADVTAGEVTEGVDIEEVGDAIAVVTGKVEIVNPGEGRDTSVILVVEETFDPNFASGEAPPGLRVAEIQGEFRIDGVPDGNYIALAAFENDFLVRDPDTSIGGTSIVRLTVSEADVQLQESFKVTGSLDVVSPDGEEVVPGTPTLIWNDDSGEDHYEVVVYDAFGNLVWEKLDVPGVSGSKTVDVPYEGPALEPGLLYQFRATSIKQGGTPLARTEDLRGVFVAG